MLTLGFLLKANAEQAQEALEQLALKTEAVTAGLEGDFASASRGITNSLISTLPVFGFVAGGIAAVGGALFEMANKASETGEQLALASKATGVSVEMLQGLQLGAKEAGVSFDQVQRGLAHLSLAMSDLEIPSSEAGKAIAKLGISTHDATGKLRNMDEILPDIFNAFQRMPEGPEKTAIALELFSRAGFQMLPILDEGAAGLAELTKKAVAYSHITTDVANKDLEFQDSLKLIKAQFFGIAQQLGQATIPIVSLLGELILHQINAWEQLAVVIQIGMDKVDIWGYKLHGMSTQVEKYTEDLEDQRKTLQGLTAAENDDGKSVGAAEKFQKAFVDQIEDSTTKLSKLKEAVEDAYQASHGKLTPEVLAAIKAYRAAAVEQKKLADLLDISDKAGIGLAKDEEKEAAAALHAAMEAKGYTAQLEAMKTVMEEINRTEEKRAELAHDKIQEYYDTQKLTAKPVPGGEIKLPSSIDKIMASMSEKMPTVVNRTAEEIRGLSDAIGQMSDKFGKASPLMQTFATHLQQVQQKMQQGKTIGQAFLDVNKQQGQTAKEAGTSMAASYGMEAAAFIKNKRAQAIVMAVMETAKGLSEVLWNPAAAVLDFASAAMYGVIAGTSGGGGGAGGGSAASPSNTGGGASQPGASQGETGGALLSSGRGGGGYGQTIVNVYGGQITDTHNLQNLAAALNSGASTGTMRLNVAGTSATIPTPAY